MDSAMTRKKIFFYASWLFRAILVLSAEQNENRGRWNLEITAGENAIWKKKRRNDRKNDGLAVEFMEARMCQSGSWMG